MNVKTIGGQALPVNAAPVSSEKPKRRSSERYQPVGRPKFPCLHVPLAILSPAGFQSQGTSVSYNFDRSTCADVAKLADAPDLGSGFERSGGSSPLIRTTRKSDVSGENGRPTHPYRGCVPASPSRHSRASRMRRRLVEHRAWCPRQTAQTCSDAADRSPVRQDRDT